MILDGNDIELREDDDIEFEIDLDTFLPCYQHLITSDEVFDIDFLYGGRDSGKSRHTAMQLIKDCMEQEYFKCLLIRKVLNTVRSSQFDLIKSIIDEWYEDQPDLKDQIWKINESRMEIICTLNGNGFFGRGLDDVGRIKSFNNPSHCWIEEGNQITNDDFVVILTSLRAKQRVKTWFTFNPECEVTYTDFWLWQEYFSHTSDLSWTWTKLVNVDGEMIEFKVRATHTTYKDNRYCSPQRKALYEGYKGSKNNSYWYQTYTLGLWGYKKSGMEFWKCFDPSLHVATLKYRPETTIHVVCDNNVTPYISVQIWQIDTANKQLQQIHEIPCEHPNNTAKKAAARTAAYLRSIDYTNVLYLYGDPSANARNTIDDEGRSFFAKFQAELNAEGYTKIANRVQRIAPGVALSGAFINEIYESNLYGWRIFIHDHCRKSIEDYTLTKENAEGGILKKKETDEDTKVSYERYGHFSDCKRYFVTTVLGNEFIKYKSRKRASSKAVE
jgi:phage terminase large subunit